MSNAKYTKEQLKVLVFIYSQKIEEQQNKMARLEERILFLESDIAQEKDMKDIEDGRYIK